jgi:hypothetical protein
MSLPDKALFRKVCELNIGGSLFTYPPFSIEFEQSFSMSSASVTKARLYNPAPTTIRKAEGKKKGDTREFAAVEIKAGFENDFGTVLTGEISDYRVYRQGVDTVLELTIGDLTGTLSNADVGKTYKNQTMGNVITDMIKTVGAKGQVTLSGDKTMKAFTAGGFKYSFENLVSEAGAQYYIKDGVIMVESKPVKKSIAFISPESGLVGGIEKSLEGYKFNTLFLYKVQGGSVVQIKDNFFDKTFVQITEAKKKFSTFGQSECEFKAVEV